MHLQNPVHSITGNNIVVTCLNINQTSVFKAAIMKFAFIDYDDRNGIHKLLMFTKWLA